MTSTALKLLAFLATLGAGGTAIATDSAPLSPLERWEADKSVVLDAAETDLSDFLWVARPVVIFADTPNDPAFRRQLALLQARQDELIERDVVIVADTDPSARTAIRTKLRPRGFMLTLIGKDGGVKLRKPFPWDVRELTRQIDKMPIRRQEIIDRKASARGG